MCKSPSRTIAEIVSKMVVPVAVTIVRATVVVATAAGMASMTIHIVEATIELQRL